MARMSNQWLSGNGYRNCSHDPIGVQLDVGEFMELTPGQPRKPPQIRITRGRTESNDNVYHYIHLEECDADKLSEDLLPYIDGPGAVDMLRQLLPLLSDQDFFELVGDEMCARGSKRSTVATNKVG